MRRGFSFIELMIAIAVNEQLKMAHETAAI
jgi:Tfp pilus assembly protein PilE